MSSTHTSLHIHIVFGTKYHEPHIDREWRLRLHSWLGGAFRTADTVPHEIGGVADHVHCLVGFTPNHRIADLLRDVKSNSSRWVREAIGLQQFGWQDGYGAFTVSASRCDSVRRYIRNQEEHHRTVTFREEYIELLKLSGVEYDPHFV